MNISPECMSVQHKHPQCPVRLEDSTRSPGTSVIKDCKLLCACWKPNLSPVKKYPVLLTADASLQPHLHVFKQMLNIFWLPGLQGHGDRWAVEPWKNTKFCWPLLSVQSPQPYHGDQKPGELPYISYSCWKLRKCVVITYEREDSKRGSRRGRHVRFPFSQ